MPPANPFITRDPAPPESGAVTVAARMEPAPDNRAEQPGELAAALRTAQRVERLQRAATRRAERERARTQAWLAARARRHVPRGGVLTAWGAPDGSCAVLGPVARWLREHGQVVAVPRAARDRREFVARLAYLANFAAELAQCAQDAADIAMPEDRTQFAARAARALSLAASIQRAAWNASLETDVDALHIGADAADAAIAVADLVCVKTAR